MTLDYKMKFVKLGNELEEIENLYSDKQRDFSYIWKKWKIDESFQNYICIGLQNIFKRLN